MYETVLTILCLFTIYQLIKAINLIYEIEEKIKAIEVSKSINDKKTEELLMTQIRDELEKYKLF